MTRNDAHEVGRVVSTRTEQRVLEHSEKAGAANEVRVVEQPLRESIQRNVGHFGMPEPGKSFDAPLFDQFVI